MPRLDLLLLLLTLCSCGRSFTYAGTVDAGGVIAGECICDECNGSNCFGTASGCAINEYCTREGRCRETCRQGEKKACLDPETACQQLGHCDRLIDVCLPR